MIRTIHHLSATGGTVICKTIAALPGAVLLSEVGPFIGKPKFFPLDPVAQYLRQVPGRRRKMVEQVFLERARLCKTMAAEDGKTLVLRDHAHNDFLSPNPRDKGTMVTVLDQAGEERRSVVTIRNPIDAWLSLVKNGWDKHVSGFDDYCVRNLAFLDAYEGSPVFRYEDFVADADTVVAAICTSLAMDYSPSWKTGWASIRLTGDSGRKSEDISVRPRREMQPALAAEIASSKAFAALAERAGYRRDFAAEAIAMADAVLAGHPGDAVAKRSRSAYAELARA